MKYSTATKYLAEILDGRDDITKVEFNRQDDSFLVTFNNGSEHLCFGSEFRGK
jgi:hypothetical protein